MRLPLALWLAVSLAATTALAQEPPVIETAPDDVKEALRPTGEANKERPEGWVFTGRAGASLSALHNHNMVGQVDGFTFQGGTVLGGSAGFFTGQHEWRNLATYELSLLRTPTIEDVLKAADNLELRSLYLYRVPGLEWLGPFARLRGFTPIFPGYTVPSEDISVRRRFIDGREEVSVAEEQVRIPLTSFLEPIVLTETAGLFVRPLEREWMTIDAKAGGGAQHVIAAGGFVVADDAATPELELRQLETIHSAGVELEAEVRGVLLDDFAYGLLATVYYPLLVSQEVDLDLVERTNLDVMASLSYRLTDWLSADYVMRVRRVPFVLNDWQIQNSLLLTVGVSSL